MLLVSTGVPSKFEVDRTQSDLSFDLTELRSLNDFASFHGIRIPLPRFNRNFDKTDKHLINF